MAEVVETTPEVKEVAELDTMEVDEVDSVEECEVLSITDRMESEGDHYYRVNWKDGDSTWEPISNLGGSSDALRTYLNEHYPTDPLLKILNSLGDDHWEEFKVRSEEEHGGLNNESDTEEKENGENGNTKLGLLARWHQKTTRGSTKYWLRKGEDDETIVPSLLKNVTDTVTEAVKDVSEVVTEAVKEAVHESFFSNTEAPLAPLEVPEAVPEVPEVVEQSGVLFSDGEMTPTPKKVVRKRYRLVEQTVRMYPHEELGDQLEVSQNRIMLMWQEMLSSVLVIGLTACFCVYLYFNIGT